MLTGLTFVFLSIGMQAQDLFFSQFYEAPLLRNPALAGLFEGDIRIQGIYRNQWNSISFPYQTGSLNTEFKMPIRQSDDHVTFAVQVLYDKAGSVGLRTNHLLPAVNYHKSISERRNTYLSLGFMGGIVNRYVDRSRITTNNQFDGFSYNGSLGDGEGFLANYSYLDATVGMSFNSTLGKEEQHVFFAGVAYHHLNKPLNAFYRNINHLPKWVLTGALRLTLDPWSNLTLHGDYIRQYPHQQLMGGAIYARKFGDEDVPDFMLHTGMVYRYKDAIIPVIRFDIFPVTLSFSYDITIGRLATVTKARGGFEMALCYATYFAQKPRSALQQVKTPRF